MYAYSKGLRLRVRPVTHSYIGNVYAYKGLCLVGQCLLHFVGTNVTNTAMAHRPEFLNYSHDL